jgi:phage shock protein A
MTGIISKLEQLEKKIQDLIEQNFEYKQKIANFEQILKANVVQLEACNKENMKLKEQIEQLNVGRAFAGIETDNEEAKQKIDGLIKEINLCIATLKE